ncbi:MAG: PA domain-containing protein [Candidatus Limnocylindria bacterium]
MLLSTLFAGSAAATDPVFDDGVATTPEHQHGVNEGHLLGTGAWGKIELVGVERLYDATDPALGPGLIADVGVDPDGEFAYLANWGFPDCAGPESGGKSSPDAGIYVVDIGNLSDPELVNFIPTHQDTRPGEGVQVADITTKFFSGEILAFNHEGCGKNYKGGFSLWDVTNPLKPKQLAVGIGDRTVDGSRRQIRDANETHSVFIWDTGDRAYLVAQDEWETSDVDIFDITNPRHPVLVAEYDLNEMGVSQPEFGLTDSFLHDVIVKQIGGQWIMLLSYWDGGYVQLNVTDPANAVLLAESDYAEFDPLFPTITPPEGNGHQAEFTIDNRFVIGTDEDFDPYRFLINTADGASWAKAATQTTAAEADGISGTTVFVGRGCTGDTAVPAAPATGGPYVAVVERGLCTFEEKVTNIATAGGYSSVIIFNRQGSDACNSVLSPFLTNDTLPVVFTTRIAGFGFFGIEAQFDLDDCLAGTGVNPFQTLAVGTVGDVVTGVDPAFDGWGYVHLFDATTMEDLDQFIIPEAANPAFAEGYGDLSVHEVAVDPLDASLAYLSYYAGGLRAVQIQCSTPADTSTCELVEVGGYLDAHGNNFWGVETFVRDGVTYILASDRDSGLWIFKDP